MKILNIAIASMLIFQSSFGVVIETCGDNQITDFFPRGDTSGKSVLTKRDIQVDCNLTITEQGPCVAWDERKQRFGVNPDEYSTFRSNDNEASLGALFATMGAYDQLEHLWSGWHGYCESGTKSDFDWASDPMYWASLAASVAMDYATAGADTSAGQTEAGQAAGAAMETASKAAVSGLQSTFASIGINLTKNMAKCLIASGVDLAFAGARSRMSEGDADGCDMVDEFCEEEIIPESDIFTMTTDRYNEIITEHPEAADMLVIIPPQEGNVLTIRYLKPEESDGFAEMSEKEQQDISKEMEELALKIDVAIIAVNLAACGVTGNASTSVQSSEDDDRASVKNGIGMAISAVPAGWMGPYGPLIKGAAQVLLSVATSFKSIDSCSDHDDAVAEGSRHEKTQESIEFNLCHKTAKTCAEKKPLIGGCMLKGYKYCCYDQLLTKVLVEQLKAQLGRDWAHCTGISIKDLKFVSFRECDKEDREAEGGNLIDGAHQVNLFDYPDEDDVIYDPDDAYQKVRHCIDMREFKDSLKKTFNSNIDMNDFQSDMKKIGEP